MVIAVRSAGVLPTRGEDMSGAAPQPTAVVAPLRDGGLGAEQADPVPTPSPVQRTLQRLFPWLYFSIFGHYMLGLIRGTTTLDPWFHAALCLVVFVAVFALEQRINREFVSWRAFLRNLLLTHVNYLVVLPLLYSRLRQVDAQLGIRLLDLHGTSTVILLVVAVLWYSLAEVGVHYWGHNTRLGWRIHSFHHRGTLNVAYAARSHLLEVSLLTVCSYLPLAILGVPHDVIAWATVLQQLCLILQHQQAWDGGITNRFITGSGAHRHHHDIRRDGVTLPVVNYGNMLPLWDHLMGTFYYRPEESPVVHTGIREEPQH